MGVRTHADEVVRTGRRKRKLDDLYKDLCNITRTCRNQYQFHDSLRRLNALLPHGGHAADAKRIAWLAAVHFQISWFQSHLGQSASSIRAALKSMALWRTAFHESRQSGYVDSFVKAVLIASNNCLLSRAPQAALEFLEVAKSAAESIRQPLGSDHFRQRGIVTLQLDQDRESAAYFDRAVTAMLERGEARTPATPLMTGPRYTTLLGTPDWDKALEIWETTREHFGEASLEYSMATNWTAACGFSTDQFHLWQLSKELLIGNEKRAAQFGHQATVTKLLSIVPDLGLYPRLARKFARRTLYENASRNS